MTRIPAPSFGLALGMITFIGPLAIHLFFPAIPAVKAAFGLSDAMAQFTFSVAVFGMAFATLVYGSLADRYGRRPVLLSGLVVFLARAVISRAGPQVSARGARRCPGEDHRPRRLRVRAPGAGDRLSDDVLRLGPDGLASHRRRAGGHAR